MIQVYTRTKKLQLYNLFLGESEFIDSLNPEGSTNYDKSQASVVKNSVSKTSSLVDPETVVEVEHLLLLFQGIISCRDISGSCNSGSGQLSDSNTEQGNHPDLLSFSGSESSCICLSSVSRHYIL